MGGHQTPVVFVVSPVEAPLNSKLKLQTPIPPWRGVQTPNKLKSQTPIAPVEGGPNSKSLINDPKLQLHPPPWRGGRTPIASPSPPWRGGQTPSAPWRGGGYSKKLKTKLHAKSRQTIFNLPTTLELQIWSSEICKSYVGGLELHALEIKHNPSKRN